MLRGREESLYTVVTFIFLINQNFLPLSKMTTVFPSSKTCFTEYTSAFFKIYLPCFKFTIA